MCKEVFVINIFEWMRNIAEQVSDNLFEAQKDSIKDIEEKNEND